MSRDKDSLSPPKWVDRLLRWRLPEEQIEEVQGDMHELYAQWVNEIGTRKARFRYTFNAFTFLRPLPKPKPVFQARNHYLTATPLTMIHNYFTIAFRNLLRHKSFSFINISGLTLGLTACLLIGLFVRDEKSFDTFIPEGERIYRIYYKVSGEDTRDQACTTAMLATVIKQNFPEVKQTLRILSSNNSVYVEAGDKKMYEQGGILADSTFFDLFPLPLTYGSFKSALSDPASIIISQNMAERFYGNEDPVGKQLVLEKQSFQIKAVFRDNANFHLPIHYILPMQASGLSEQDLQNWDWYAFYNYVRLKQGTDVQSLQAKFAAFTDPFLNKGEGGFIFKPAFQALQDIHLYSSDFKFDMAERGNITYVKALTIIALFILLIACFNFVNLATAKSLQRAKEVGVRKTIGATRKQLMTQYISETVLLTLLSICISVVLTYLILPWMNAFTEKNIVFDLFTNPFIIPLLLLLTVVVGILAGFYPALVLSGFQPVKVLKSGLVTDSLPGSVPWLRHVLVVTQFSLSVLLIIGAIVVITQVNYLHNKDLGFEKEQILFFPLRGDNLYKNYESFKQELLRSPSIASVSVGYGFPGDIFGDGLMSIPRNGQQKKATQLMVDHDYIKTLGLELVAGRDFSKEMATDGKQAFIINETAVKELGLGSPEQALGETLLWPTWRNPDSVKKAQIIGVVKDFHYKSLYDKVEPAVLQIYPEAYSRVAVKMKTADIGNTIQYVKNIWNKFSPEYPIEYRFMDESFDQMYKAEDKLKSLLGIFTATTIFVACLGLFGLAAYAAERRKKEIGIRKVLGASAEGIVVLLLKEFVKLVVLALVIATPVAWYMMSNWLDDFPYRINLEWWIFAVAGSIAILIALLTVSFQSVKAALINPIKYLRSE
jgi:putative ABC transport system permease protein